MLEGYKILITGATSGMGLATAKEFIEQGATVIGIGRNFGRTVELGERFIPFKCDVTDPDQIIAAREFAEKTFGSLDSLICNAGTTTIGTPENIEKENLDHSYALHFRNHIMFVKEMVPLLRKSDNPSISITSSVGAWIVHDEQFDYCALKAGLNYYIRAAAHTFEGIRCNAVCPGLIKTNIFSEEEWKVREENPAILASIPLGRIGEAWEVAKLFAFLASEEASYVDGAIIVIDGGYQVTHPRVDILK